MATDDGGGRERSNEPDEDCAADSITKIVVVAPGDEAGSGTAMVIGRRFSFAGASDAGTLPEAEDGPLTPAGSSFSYAMRRAVGLPGSRQRNISDGNGKVDDGEELECPDGCLAWIAAARGEAKPFQNAALRRAGWSRGADGREASPNPTVGQTFWKAVVALDVVLRGFSQVYFVSNPLTGLLLWIALAIGSPAFGIVAFACCAVNNFVAASVVGVDWDEQLFGLYGYDAVLVGAAVETFLWPGSAGDAGPWVVATTVTIAIAAATACTFVRKTFARACSALGVPAFTIGFNVVGLALLYGHHGGLAFAPPSEAAARYADVDDQLVAPLFYVEALLLGVSQLHFIGTLPGAAVAVAGLAWGDLSITLLLLLGSLVGAGTALAAASKTAATFRAVQDAARFGLFGYNACATAAVPHLFVVPPLPPDVLVADEQQHGSRRRIAVRRAVRVALAGAAAAAFASFATFAFDGGLSVPVLTLPFVIVSWFLVGAFAHAQPAPSPPPTPEREATVRAPSMLSRPPSQLVVATSRASGAPSAPSVQASLLTPKAAGLEFDTEPEMLVTEA